MQNIVIQPPAGHMFREEIRHKYCINGPYYEFDVGRWGNKRACRILHDESGWHWYYGLTFGVDKDIGQRVWCISCGMEDTYEAALEACEDEGREELIWVI
jgi:hypothetical protein